MDPPVKDFDYVYLWADGIHVNIRLEEHKLCLLGMIGVRADGGKELVALADGYRESAEPWADLLRDELLAFCDYPAEHWIHLRTTNPIESTFATVRHRKKVTKGPGSRAAGQAMAFKLIESAQARWRAVDAPHLVALVRVGARFERGVLIERDEVTAAEVTAA